eukprot:Opistho-2@48688
MGAPCTTTKTACRLGNLDRSSSRTPISSTNSRILTASAFPNVLSTPRALVPMAISRSRTTFPTSAVQRSSAKSASAHRFSLASPPSVARRGAPTRHVTPAVSPSSSTPRKATGISSVTTRPSSSLRTHPSFPTLSTRRSVIPRRISPIRTCFGTFSASHPSLCTRSPFSSPTVAPPDGYRHMNGYGSHTFAFVNAEGKRHWVKFHFKTEQGIKNLPAAEAKRIAGENPDYAQQDLFEAIERGDSPAWRVFVQVMKEEDAAKYRFNPFDITKVWPHSDYPLQPVGRMVLNRNPENYFAEIEQAAFSPSHLVPGIEASPDRMLQGRLFSYPDTHRHRLGANYLQIPVNCPFAARVINHQRDGAMSINGNGGSAPNYEPNSHGGPKESKAHPDITPVLLAGATGRFSKHWPSNKDGDRYDYVQAGNLYRIMTPQQKSNLIDNIVGHLRNANRDLQKRQVEIFKKADAEYGSRIERGLAQAKL